MMRIERRTGLGGSTQRLHQKESSMVRYQGEGQNDVPDPTRKASR